MGGHPGLPSPAAMARETDIEREREKGRDGGLHSQGLMETSSASKSRAETLAFTFCTTEQAMSNWHT